jgi:hypothetical protein
MSYFCSPPSGHGPAPTTAEGVSTEAAADAEDLTWCSSKTLASNASNSCSGIEGLSPGSTSLSSEPEETSLSPSLDARSSASAAK